MSNRTKQKRIKMGYAAYINRTSEKGGWERVGFLFNTSLEAKQFLDRNHPQITKWSVEAVRVNSVPVSNFLNNSQ